MGFKHKISELNSYARYHPIDYTHQIWIVMLSSWTSLEDIFNMGWSTNWCYQPVLKMKMHLPVLKNFLALFSVSITNTKEVPTGLKMFLGNWIFKTDTKAFLLPIFNLTDIFMFLVPWERSSSRHSRWCRLHNSALDVLFFVQVLKLRSRHDRECLHVLLPLLRSTSTPSCTE